MPLHEIVIEMKNVPAKKSTEKLLEGDMARFTKILDDDYAVGYRIRLAPGQSTGRHVYIRPALMVRLPDGGFEWMEAGSDREIQNPADAKNESSLLALVFK